MYKYIVHVQLCLVFTKDLELSKMNKREFLCPGNMESEKHCSIAYINNIVTIQAC